MTSRHATFRWSQAPEGEPAELQLWPQRGAFDAHRSCLFVADAHFGKDHTFRRHGLAVPASTEQATLHRLDTLLALTQAQHLVFLGDLFHGPASHDPSALAPLQAWRESHPALNITLVRGNHDHHAGDPPPGLGMAVRSGPWRLGPWALMHEPEPLAGAYALGGHWHPGVVLQERGRTRLRLPCFHFHRQHGILPALGDFTGLHIGRRSGDDEVFAVVEEAATVMPLPTHRSVPHGQR